MTSIWAFMPLSGNNAVWKHDELQSCGSDLDAQDLPVGYTDDSVANLAILDWLLIHHCVQKPRLIAAFMRWVLGLHENAGKQPQRLETCTTEGVQTGKGLVSCLEVMISAWLPDYGGAAPRDPRTSHHPHEPVQQN